jgi:hypothetical protein
MHCTQQLQLSSAAQAFTSSQQASFAHATQMSSLGSGAQKPPPPLPVVAPVLPTPVAPLPEVLPEVPDVPLPVPLPEPLAEPLVAPLPGVPAPCPEEPSPLSWVASSS